ncbi:MAG: hypothetical protein AUK44_00945 [Porphyromonadaceae bacterium CG2_30_38_12]|nr:MAG: hypothetical protein AUK44_00945 [Porphyromonadaceae bacterium CG2_30_38_12]
MLKIYRNLFFLGLLNFSVFLQAQVVRSVEGVSITVSNLKSAIAFYTKVLPFELDTVYITNDSFLQSLYNLQDSSLCTETAQLRLGDEKIELVEFHSASYRGRPIPSASKSNDLWFQHIAIVVNDMEKAYKILEQNNVTHVSTMPQTLPVYIPAAAGIKAFYFRDTDGHNLELIQFPKGKGNPKWEKYTDITFLGIDHTAIGVEATNTSLDFFTHFLHLEVAGESINYGVEQEHLNQVFGAHLRITGLKATQGMGIELLDYIAPPGGMPYMADTNPTDVWYWLTKLKVDNVDAYYNLAKNKGLSLKSLKLTTLNKALNGISKAFIVSDTDGHAYLIYE